MSDKKRRITSKGLDVSGVDGKPCTALRAAITADIRPSRGKQLVEHSPWKLIPDPENPRPGEVIDDNWLIDNLHLGKTSSLCLLMNDGNYYIPEFSELNISYSENIESSYTFLRNLAFSIRTEGLIEPVEIFLADKNNDPEYFEGSDIEFGYVILEGHQRRLASMLAGVKTITCIEITDETVLAKLKVNHRKIRRQLSENNLRKNLTTGQNFLILRELLKDPDISRLGNKEISAIIGLNEDIVGSIKRICLEPGKYPKKLSQLIIDNLVNFKWLRFWVSKNFSEISSEVENILSGHKSRTSISKNNSNIVKRRGLSGGALKRMATFKISNINDGVLLQKYLLDKIPDLKEHGKEDLTFKDLEALLERLLVLSKVE